MNTTTETTASGKPSQENPARGKAVFVTTHWSEVLMAGQHDTTRARAALDGLCQSYWYPLYAYVRRRGYSAEDAQDLTQEFFARLFGRNWLAHADRQKGRFRSFLLSALNHFLSDQWDKARAQKRGGGLPPLPLPLETAEGRYSHELADNSTPEQNYERRWALELLEQVLGRLKAEYEAQDRAGIFDALHPCLTGGPAENSYAEIALDLAMTEAAVKAAAHRLRQRYRQLLRGEVARTVASPGEVDEELRHLCAVLASGSSP